MGIPKVLTERLYKYYMKALNLDNLIPGYKDELTDNQIRIMKKHNLMIILECLKELGYDMEEPVKEP